jgi:hypothetical protein
MEEMEEKLKSAILIYNGTKKHANLAYLYLSSFCHGWVQRQNDPLCCLVVYRDTHYRENDKSLQRLLLGIPGLKITPWEGGLFPFLDGMG